MATTNNIIQYKEFSSLANVSFWHELSSKKLDVLKLKEDPLPVNAYYSYSTSQQLDPFLCLEYNSFLLTKSQSSNNNTTDRYFEPPTRSFLSNGILYNYNTAEDFKQSPKAKLFEDASKQIWNDIKSGNIEKDPTLLNRFIVLTFADIKNHQFYYLFGIPALLPTQPFETIAPTVTLEETYNEQQIQTLHSSLQSSTLPFFLIKNNADSSISVGSIDQWDSYFNDIEVPTVGFCDPCALSSNPGWPLRNFLLYLSTARPNVKKVRVVCYRANIKVSGEQTISSIVLTVALNSNTEWSGKSVGWEKDTNGKIAPRFISLASTMDPMKLASQSVDLNLKLMRWRVMPSLDLETIKETKCLLLGSGTLGCNVARCLLSWGVRNVTFVDSSKVSYSNPVRQSLFNFEDCTPKAKEKSVAAAESLKRIFPAVNATSHVFSIPMPGHSVSASQEEAVKSVFENLEDLVKKNDVIFLLTDSRESRWLPTLLARYHNKQIINAALGFDSYLIVRHGIREPNANESDTGAANLKGQDLGCYFCNDVIAPTDTLKDRTLDQMCTVTRPGLSMMASAIAVELMISILHHPIKGRAQAETETDIYAGASTPLGIVPHQLRGFLSHYQTMPLFGHPFKHCTACSDQILEEFKNRGWDFILQVLNDSTCLTKIAGIDNLNQEDVNIDWEIDLSDDDDDEKDNE
ncbi:hypothetical protein CYY_006412 [Polysphondylium violaceum]|uniref:Ubiquitin-like modifier-activating enzyme ATG7 n=1 Tax=Polysphondylium violaceum TaxID=133409 RepID=A0A8J4PQG4_9MYCE|nr:hypothetical protein CYY_006412 [Polysphondylium violaceum]